MKQTDSQQTRLYLALSANKTIAAVNLADALAAADVAAVLLRMPLAEPRALLDRIKSFAPPVQSAGAALLVNGHPDLVARGGADGAHFSSVTDLQEALPFLKPQRTAGAGGLVSRHDAMIAGEAGADYVLFGDPDRLGERPSTEAIADRIAWWAEVFQIPCVGYATRLEECEEFAAAGADFVLVEDMIWNDPRGAVPALMDAAAAIGQSRGTARPKAEAEL